ncbi:hypothetical protein [Natrinema altunense]|uniref:Uncharacterized protein n=1 Tax=Natrinema altunense (strain JCM 12890 / CGMCC 1.3731 / AJ2) TaxID=1227494 RepID=L9ZL93_NATA2|nr:hypothetical protein [Natrinema altunense]ELY85938.1 hypothetical protein C485_12073 [Natrinema altunense JCM 12890]
MSTESDYFDRLPMCPGCGRILGEPTRLDHEPTRRECRHCRLIFDAHEVFRH